MGTINSFLNPPLRAWLCSYPNLCTSIFLPGEKCPPSQQEGLKLEYRSDLSTNVTGECPSHPAVPPLPFPGVACTHLPHTRRLS